MDMNIKSLSDKEKWNKIGVEVPKFDINQTALNTDARAEWVHFGAGNIFRGFIANINQRLLNKNLVDTGIVAVDTFDFDIIDKIYKPFDNLTMLVSLNSDGTNKKEIMAGVSRAYKGSSQYDDYNKLIEIFENDSLKMVSFTITEKGYSLKNITGEYLDVVSSDISNGPDSPKHVISIITSLVYKRYLSAKKKLALCSMDNCSHNGEVLKKSVINMATEWLNNNYVEEDFITYLNDENYISFPWSMIDKITPRPDDSICSDLEQSGLNNMKPIVTSVNTYIAPFVNAEVAEYLVIENNFPNGSIPLNEGGVYLTDRDTVNKTETMKVTTCLNPLHTALAVYGCLLGYDRIYKEMNDPLLSNLVKKIGYEEGLKVVVDPKIISPKEFIDEVINERLTNPFIPDDPARIATDTSQKVGIRFGETIKSYIKSEELDVQNLVYIPLAIAGWMRYLLGVDDNGNTLSLSPDPMLDQLTLVLSSIKLGGEYNNELTSILTNETIFGVNLVECGLSNKIEEMFIKMIVGNNAVHNTLNEYLGKEI
ncbi:MAG: mannitol dehydrogenase family protein [bacterium]